VKGDIEFKNINFSYPSRKDVKVQQHIFPAVRNCIIHTVATSVEIIRDAMMLLFYFWIHLNERFL